MNVVSVTVTGALMGMLAPAVSQMSIQPFIAQKRASNFSVAESSAVTYAALNEGAPATTPVPDGCELLALDESNAFSITCSHGESRFKQSVMRSFRLAVIEGDTANTDITRREYTPGVFCPLWDPWGIINYNDSHNVQCIPVPYGPWAYTYNGEMLW
jgi:hypothetical protein